MELEREKLLREALRDNPGGDEFAELAELLSADAQRRPEAREICFRGLSENPRHAKGRLVLAKLFYLDGLGEFCVRELVELSRYVSNSPSLERLVSAFGEFGKQFLAERPTAAQKRSATDAAAGAAGGESSKVVAELDLDADFDDLLEDLEEE